MNFDRNPFPESDSDRYELWEMLVRKDIDAFLNADRAAVITDFTEGHFLGIHANGSANPDDWTLAYPSLEDYLEDWQQQAEDFAKNEYRDDPRRAIFEATRLEEIEVRKNTAILHKKFDGSITHQDGKVDILDWQTVYHCKKEGGRWKIIGFVGYLPHRNLKSGL